ncbi:coenzyme A biosynthesis bifunctional protein [Thermacetogenium phaeum DSM 12270]|uniref:Coenzyme A biosynthesis bifunctional protein CoaBC n=1 Tax=Thermacetogenium phaeum (strain ATCC BAA-254 / DSM 26808 / PB) TaxID=1089553 RepID=K4LF27_THEPS|nr:bifunctional phosphopantothenoylcysteine decarboxylase/phosphopantothenate--cysteine ligase CoaBC [Thermacetogenium phaeum]AFV11641.1 coenzyme A biosynthesis bifunctional protein [Thermacetogenium phaeum DSM 12270]
MKKNIVLGVTGSIAAYKAAEIASLLIKKGYKVEVVMTRSATQFITPLTLQSITQSPVHTEMFAAPRQLEIEHISLAQKADLLLVAPATANIIGKVAGGIADDLLSTTIMATRAPVIFAPAMNVGMYENPVFQHWMNFLRGYGFLFIEPDEGRLACGARGKGRLPPPERIVSYVEDVLNRQDELSGIHVLVTAGPTREPLDAVRFLSNYSSGKMGYALAEEAKERGARVTLISGPTKLEPPQGVNLISVQTAEEMFNAVKENFAAADVVIKAAAVADFRPRWVTSGKIKKESADLLLELERTPDILAYLGQNKSNQILVGFAAETEDLLVNAREKLARKNLDMIVANDLTEEGAGFDVDTNVATILFPEGEAVELPRLTKKELAGVILDQVAKLLRRTKEDKR